MARSLQWRIYYHRMWGQISNTCSNLLKQPNRELLDAVNHKQLQTMASETLDPIDWSHPPPSWAVAPECLVYSINQSSFIGNLTCNRSLRGNHLDYAATQSVLRATTTSRCNSSQYAVLIKKCGWGNASGYLEVTNSG